MSATITLLATAAVTVGTVSVVKAVKRRIIEGERRLDAIRARQARRRETPVLDLEADAQSGAYVLRDRRVAPD